MSLDYGSLTQLQKKYVFSLDPQLYDLGTNQMSNFDSMCIKLDAINDRLALDSRDQLSIRCGLLLPTEVFELESGDNDAHMACAAVDVDDFDGSLFDWFVTNGTAEDLGLEMRSLDGYVHIELDDWL